MTFSVEIPVRWMDLDVMGHVNNATYLNYLEEVRDRLYEACLGDAWTDVVLARIEIDYRREITRSAGRVVASIVVESIGTTSIRTREEIRFSDGALSAQSRTVSVLCDPGTRKPRPLTETERTALGEHQSI